MDRCKVCAKCGCRKHEYNEATSQLQCAECGSNEIVQEEGY